MKQIFEIDSPLSKQGLTAAIRQYVNKNHKDGMTIDVEVTELPVITATETISAEDFQEKIRVFLKKEKIPNDYPMLTDGTHHTYKISDILYSLLQSNTLPSQPLTFEEFCIQEWGVVVTMNSISPMSLTEAIMRHTYYKKGFEARQSLPKPEPITREKLIEIATEALAKKHPLELVHTLRNHIITIVDALIAQSNKEVDWEELFEKFNKFYLKTFTPPPALTILQWFKSNLGSDNK